MKIKTSELTDAALDWAVAKCEGPSVNAYGDEVKEFIQYSREWAQGGPITHREHITLQSPTNQLTMFWVASLGRNQHRQFDHDPLVAAMRCYVVSKLGDEVEVPDDLA